MVLRSFLVLGAISWASIVSAEGDTPTDQRCIEACLAQSGGAADPAYDACVAASCGAGAAAETPPQRTPDTTQAWYSGARGAGRAFAAIDLPDRAGEAGVIFACERGGPDRVAMRGFRGPPGRMLFIVGDHFFPLQFAQAGDLMEAPAPAGLADALQRGERLTVAAANGKPFFTLTLAGADAAIGKMRAGC